MVETKEQPDAAALAHRISTYFDRLWPLPRSLTGNGVRETHAILSEILPLERMEIPTGTKVLDWEVPQEWEVNEAYIKSPDGKRIVDFRANNLHVLGYSIPFLGTLSREKLDAHLHSLPSIPAAIPYYTSYYAPRWGFCLSHEQRSKLAEGDYEVVVDTRLFDGSMTLSHALLRGETEREIMFSSYTCHPSMANNELSGPLVLAFLYEALARIPKRRFTYRFVLVPETIGAIAYLDKFGQHLMRSLEAGYVLTCVGGTHGLTYKRSRRGDSAADRAAVHVLRTEKAGESPKILDFFPSGSDERQYCSPGFNLPVGGISRPAPAEYPEYHTSFDNREFVSFEAMVDMLNVYLKVCRVLETNKFYKNLHPWGEPRLGTRGLQSTMGAQREREAGTAAVKWLLSFADGTNDLISIAERSGVDYWLLEERARACVAAGLLAEMTPEKHGL